MYVCKLCELEIEDIPTDAVRIGNVYQFSDGTFHFLRKKIERKASHPETDESTEKAA